MRAALVLSILGVAFIVGGVAHVMATPPDISFAGAEVALSALFFIAAGVWRIAGQK